MPNRENKQMVDVCTIWYHQEIVILWIVYYYYYYYNYREEEKEEWWNKKQHKLILIVFWCGAYYTPRIYTHRQFSKIYIFYVFASSLKCIMYGVHGVDHVSARGECCAVNRIHNAIWNSIFFIRSFYGRYSLLCVTNSSPYDVTERTYINCV